MRRTLFGVLAALFLAAQPLGDALAIEAKQLREDIIAGLALYGGPGAGLPLTYDEVRVWPKDGGHRVEIAGLMGENIELGVQADLGDVAFSVQETKPGHYRVFDLSIPASVPVIDGEGRQFALLAYDLQRFDGVWVSALANFLDFDLLVTDLKFALADGGFTLAMDRLGAISRGETGADGRIDQQAEGRATGLRVVAAGEGTFEVDEIEVETDLAGLDLEAYAQLTQEYEALAAREGGPSNSDMAAFVQRLSALNVLPARLAERFAITGLRVTDADGRSQVRLDQGELDFAASGIDQPRAELRLGLKHDNLELGEGLRAEAGAMSRLLPRNMGLVTSVEDLPMDRIWQSALRTFSFMLMQGGQEGQDPAAMQQIMMFMLMGELLPALTEAGTQLKLPHFLIESEVSTVTAEGALNINPASPLGVTGAMDVVVTGLDEVIALLEAEVNAGNQEAFQMLGMANWMRSLSRRDSGGENGAVDRYNLELTADGQTLLNGQPFAPIIPQ